MTSWRWLSWAEKKASTWLFLETPGCEDRRRSGCQSRQALIPLPQALWESIIDKVLDRAFWEAKGGSEPTLPCFAGEFKRNTASHNRNQLMIDMATFQSQLRALGLTKILWGATYAGGVFEIFSSRRKGTKRDVDPPHIVVLYVSAIQQTVISSHGVLNLIDPVSFLKCYSFLANLALDADSEPFPENLKSFSAANILKSMQATAWRAPTVTDTKSEKRSAVDVVMSSKRPKPDGDSDGGGGGSRVNPKDRKRNKKDPGGVSRGAKDRSGGSDAHQDAKGKGRAHAGGSGGDEAKDRMESLDSALDDDNLDSLASVGSATFCEERRIEARMARQPTSCSLKRGLLEATKWRRSSISI
ncbi:hypothetical protein PILCRDRAFT_827342 [Piloderma croceum F 1598]|uniref:Uncharacterized protein n=1 Tax=Piloderma croceum (strain F 1598) TaxID=765440 RepID=A0A0C3AND6_PILCF|nr:hypothetical protein PILCRDRAFT_827342 [Piloderma croceum F 1598]